MGLSGRKDLLFYYLKKKRKKKKGESPAIPDSEDFSLRFSQVLFSGSRSTPNHPPGQSVLNLRIVIGVSRAPARTLIRSTRPL